MRGLAVLLIAAACGDTATVIIDPMGPAECEKHCATTIEVTLGDRTASAPCGEVIEFEGVPVGDQIPLQVTVQGLIVLSGSGFVVAASGEAIDVSIDLAPETPPPYIEEIDRPGAILYGEPTVISLIGSGFGDRNVESKVMMTDGSPVEVDAWSDKVIRVKIQKKGTLVVSRCGVESEEFPLELRTVVAETYQIAGLGDCVTPRLLAGETSASDELHATVSFSCGACRESYIAELDPSIDEVAHLMGPVEGGMGDGCFRDVARINDGLYMVVRNNFTGRCDVLGDGGLDCYKADTASIALDVTRVSDDVVAYVIAGEGGPRLYEQASTTTTSLLPDEVREAVAVEGRFLLGWNFAGAPILIQWKRPPPTGALVPRPLLDGCTMPLALRTQLSAGVDRLVAICQGPTGLEIAALGEITTLLPGLTFEDAALDVAGRVLWIWTGDALAFVDIVEGELLGTMSLTESYEGARLLRAGDRDRFLLGGPEAGQVTRFRIE